MIGVAVVGYGYWGPNLVRNFMEVPETRLDWVCDLDEGLLGKAKARYPTIRPTGDLGEVLGDPGVDAVAIATPVFTHFELGMRALKAGKNVLLEKPLAATSDEAARLVEEADRRGLLLMVDHTFPYTGAVRKIREMTAAGELGDLYYYDSVRVNLGLFQHDVDVIWDLAVHDLSIMDHVLPNAPVAVAATGMSHVKDQPENVAYLTLFFESNLIAHVHVNWLAPVKVRQVLIGGSKRMIVYNDLEPSEKIRIYDKGVMIETNPDNIYNMRVGYRTGDMWAPNLDSTEALRRLVGHFAACLKGEETPITSAESGLRVVRTMEAATESMRNLGQPVKLER